MNARSNPILSYPILSYSTLSSPFLPFPSFSLNLQIFTLCMIILSLLPQLLPLPCPRLTLPSCLPLLHLSLLHLSPLRLSPFSVSHRSSGAGAAKLKKINAEFSSSSSSSSLTDAHGDADAMKVPQSRGGNPTISYPNLYFPTIPYPTLPYPTLPYPIIPNPTLPYTALACLVLPYPALPCIALLLLPCHSLPALSILFLSRSLFSSSSLVPPLYYMNYSDCETGHITVSTALVFSFKAKYHSACE